MRKYRDLLDKQASLDMRSVRSSVMVATLAYSDITVNRITVELREDGVMANELFISRQV